MKLIFLKQSLSFIIIALVMQYTYSQTLETQIDSIITIVFNDKEGPGGVFLVAKHGKPIYKKAFGKANMELGVNMTPENVFQIGSMTKQFTSLGILMLQEQNKLDVNDAIVKYIPDYPNGEHITIHHLLTHTSGIKDFTKMKSIMSIARKDLTPKELVDFFKDEPIDFQPGEKFAYNNSGYVVLGYIIELVSGTTYEEFIEQNIFKAIGMNDSRYANDREIVKNRAYGYHNRGAFTNKMYVSLSIPYASGSLMSTVDDMLKWQEAINNNLLVSQSTIDKVFSKNTLNNGEQFTYGYGWHLKNIDEVPTREHGGSIFGFKSMGVYVPSLDIYVVGFSNCDCNSPTITTKNIAKLMIDTFKKN
ncbi:serine hydrolase domain-containing protein [Pontimicrobium aquaticum]|uniref:Beta-lactamase family protein n=1 Tax=Pontimicrobium aquaticum TaxID=2565367 RepID=A0A4U0EZZ3_9FLAO|nr:serine hydrolase domain-containing protein [Pontimicrobium aquaticum]TJY35962.1 beta-lactamase family protein [Pontimicrobium aquaticum]